MQAFSEANRGEARYRVRTVSTRETIRTEQGLTLSSLEPLPEVGAETLVVIPGMPYRATQRLDPKAVRWVERAHRAGARIASVCTGAFVLGEAGLLDGRRCTTHWNRVEELKRRYPRAKVIGDRLFIGDERVITSAGIAAGIDMSLALIEEAHGPLLAAQVAHEMVVYMRRDGAQGQTSVYLDYRTHLHPGIHRVQDWIVQNPARDISLDALADVGATSRRNLTRLFRRATGVSIKDYATRVRLELAATLLHDPGLTVEGVAARAGFAGGRQLRRAWKASHGTAIREDPQPRALD